jgi:ribosome modulation factor
MNKRKTKDKRDAYEEGNEAAHSNKSAADCPYNFSTKDGQDWLKGYEENGGTD